MKRSVSLLLALLALLTACAQQASEPQQDVYTIYYVSPRGGTPGEDAIMSGSTVIENGAEKPVETLARTLLDTLLASEEARGTFPAGTEVRSLHIAGRRAQVDLSSQYEHLSGIDLSLADYCLALTLTQLEGVNAVTVTAEGHAIPYRATQLLLAADTLLGSREDALRPINVSLYFLDTTTGELRAQQQTLALHEGQQRVSALLEALLLGPENDASLRPLLPEGFAVAGSRIDDGVCTLSLAADVPLPEDPGLRSLALESLEQSLLSLGGVEQVRIRIGGEFILRQEAADAGQAEN